MKVLKPSAVIICTLGWLSCFSQQKIESVISSAGDVSKGGGITLEWTLGETAVETASTHTELYTQGFHQPLLQVQKISTLQHGTALKNDILVYPNPASSVINLKLETPSASELIISFMDAGGKMVLSNRLPTNSSFLMLNVSNLPQGAYILRITDAIGSTQSDYKIIKAQ